MRESDEPNPLELECTALVYIVVEVDGVAIRQPFLVTTQHAQGVESWRRVPRAHLVETLEALERDAAPMFGFELPAISQAVLIEAFKRWAKDVLRA